MDPAWLELELTESVTMDSPDEAIAVIDRLAGDGIKVSIDDFGTGYSSLTYLKQLKIYKLKIDQSFVQNIASSKHDRSIIATIINLSDNLDLKTIAEGVESPEQRDTLIQLGCHEMQGYLFSPPLPAHELENLLRNNHTKS